MRGYRAKRGGERAAARVGVPTARRGHACPVLVALWAAFQVGESARVATAASGRGGADGVDGSTLAAAAATAAFGPCGADGVARSAIPAAIAEGPGGAHGGA